MFFSEFAQMLYPCFGSGKNQSDFVVMLIENSLIDTDDDFLFFDKTPEYLSRIFRGDSAFPQRDATYVIGHIDKEKFISFVLEFTDDAIAGVCKELEKHNIFAKDKAETAAKCADMLFETMSQSLSRKRKNAPKTRQASDPFDALKILQESLDSIPAPKTISPPSQSLPEEHPYITALYAAYGDREDVIDFDESQLALFGDYEEDIKERRIDYFSAETIRRGVTELYSGEYANQFDVLKEETYDGVKNTERRRFPDGYERMLAVMEQAVKINVQKYMLSASPNWISNKILKGMCHFLVNESKLRWVKK